jgi:hypothetical protein
VLEPRSRRPSSSPSKLTDQVKEQAVQVRAALEASGLDHGPISVHDKMQAMGLDPVPSTASLARIFHVDKVTYVVDVSHRFEQVLVVTNGARPGDKITITDLEGEILAEHHRPETGVTYVGNGRPPGTRAKNPQVSPKS